MTLPARDRPGSLGRYVIADGHSREFRDFRFAKPATSFTLSVRTDQNVTVSVYRIDAYGQASLHADPVNVAAMSGSTSEETLVYDYPVGGLGIRVIVANASGFAATVQVEASAGGQGSAGRA